MTGSYENTPRNQYSTQHHMHISFSKLTVFQETVFLCDFISERVGRARYNCSIKFGRRSCEEALVRLPADRGAGLYVPGLFQYFNYLSGSGQSRDGEAGNKQCGQGPKWEGTCVVICENFRRRIAMKRNQPLTSPCTQPTTTAQGSPVADCQIF